MPPRPPRQKPKTVGKSAKYEKKFNKDWESKPIFKGWLHETSRDDVMSGKPHAYCSYCDCYLRAHKYDLKVHAKCKKHVDNASAIPKAQGSRQGTLDNHGITVKSSESKKTDLTLAVHIACHSAVKTIDHLGPVLKRVGAYTGTKCFDNLRLHRTKCSKLITNVVAPAMLQETIDDIGDGYYSTIVDESTDTTACKWLAIMVKYYSFKKKEMVTDLLGLVETPRATAPLVHQAFTSYMNKIGLRLDRMSSLGTDGGLNLCGSNNSLFALLKRNECPDLQLFKCICHALDKCASTAAKCLPASLEFLLRESRGWFSHSSVRKADYAEVYSTLTNNGAKPPQLVRLAATRWLAWYGAVKAHVAQYKELHELFKRAAHADSKEQCHMAHTLAALHAHGTHLLYLKFLQPILRELTALNVAFQRSSGDVVSLYADLKSFIFSLAGKVLKADAIKQTQSTMLRLSELQALQVALQRKENYRPIDLVKFGDGFYQTALELKLPEEKLLVVKNTCADYLLKLTHELTQRLPSCVEIVEKVRAFQPSVALSDGRARPEFQSLPLDYIRRGDFDRELIETQWEKLGTMKLETICPEAEDIKDVTMVQFWGAVWDVRRADGQQVFGELARFVLSVLTFPTSNAVVERLFSVLALVKNKLRNKMSLKMLESILRVRTHLHANNLCCNGFVPTLEMLRLFNSKVMYDPKKAKRTDQELEEMDFDVDDPEAEEPVLQIDMDDLDTDVVPIEAFDEMLDLLDSIENDLD